MNRALSGKYADVAKPIGADKHRLDRTLVQALGAEITELRIKHNCPQSELAHRLGYTDGYLRRVEQGSANPSLELLSAVSTFFRLNLSVLIANAERRSEKIRNQTPAGLP